MTDVRLTATNPEDSSVVPVACNAKGELVLEEPGVGPAGPKGEKGDPGEPGAAGADGDPFTGNFDGDVSFGGAANFDSPVSIDGNENNVALTVDGVIQSFAPYRQKMGNNWNYAQIEMIRRASNINRAKFLAFCLDGDDPADVDLGAYPLIEVVYNTIPRGGSTSIDLSAKMQIGGPGGVYVQAAGTTYIDVDENGYTTFGNDVIVNSKDKEFMLVESNGLCHMVQGVQKISRDGKSQKVYPELRDIPGELTIVQEQLQRLMEKLQMLPEPD